MQPVLELSVQPTGKFLDGQTDAEEELAEEGVDGADFVETHLVDELLEDHRVVGEEVDAPLPVVHAD